MTTSRFRTACSALAIFAAGQSVAHAQYYGGLDFIRFSKAGAEVLAPEPSFFIANTALDDRRIRYGFKIGYQVTPQFALVSKYSEFDRRTGSAMLPLDSRAEAASPRSYGLDMVGSMPVFERFSLSGSAGFARIRGDAIFGGNAVGLFPNPAARALSAGKLGVGVQYNFSNSLGLRFEAERYRNFSAASSADADADNYSFGVTVKF